MLDKRPGVYPCGSAFRLPVLLLFGLEALLGERQPSYGFQALLPGRIFGPSRWPLRQGPPPQECRMASQRSTSLTITADKTPISASSPKSHFAL